MPEYGIPTNNDYTIGEDFNSQYYTDDTVHWAFPPPTLILHRTVGHSPLTDSRGVMTCDCDLGNDCCSYDHWRHRWVLVDPHPGNCECHSCNRHNDWDESSWDDEDSHEQRS